MEHIILYDLSVMLSSTIVQIGKLFFMFSSGRESAGKKIRIIRGVKTMTYLTDTAVRGYYEDAVSCALKRHGCKTRV